jgi:hypothetical protein
MHTEQCLCLAQNVFGCMYHLLLKKLHKTEEHYAQYKQRCARSGLAQLLRQLGDRMRDRGNGAKPVLQHNAQTSPRALPATYRKVMGGGESLGVKRPGSEANHYLHVSAVQRFRMHGAYEYTYTHS